MIAVKHVDGVLQMLGPDTPRLDKALSAKAVELRHPPLALVEGRARKERLEGLP
jgi:hypothetical protein